MDISKRLKTIAHMADAPVIADIGCDHALVCVEALQQGKVQKAYACDLRAKPLEQARRNIVQAGLQERIFIRLQNGLETLPEDVEQIIISGMGGSLIETILEANPPHNKVRSLLLCPHKDAPHLRRWLVENGWMIDLEKNVQEDHSYPIIQASRCQGAIQLLAPEEELYGKNAMASPDRLLYLNFELERLKRRLEQMPDYGKPAVRQSIELAELALGQAEKSLQEISS